MVTLTRKQRELRQREDLILEVGRRMLLERGYPGLNMDRVAEATEYSKGTIYQHFANKEDLVVGVCLQTMQQRADLFARAGGFQGTSRERMTAIGVADELFVRLYPDHFRTELLLKVESIFQKSSRARQAALEACEAGCSGIIQGILRDAIAQRDLIMPDGVALQDLMFGLWSMAWGAHAIQHSGVDLAGMGIHDMQGALRVNMQRLLDGFAWRPLSSDFDYAKSYQRILEEVYPDESRRAFPR